LTGTTDRILQHKQNLYDLLVKLPPHDGNHSNPILVPSPDSSFSTHVSTKINATDIRRYRVLLRLLAAYGENHLEMEEDGGDMTDTWRKMMFGGWFWWYGRNNGYQRLNNDNDESLGNSGMFTNLINIGRLKDAQDVEVELIR